MISRARGLFAICVGYMIFSDAFFSPLSPTFADFWGRFDGRWPQLSFYSFVPHINSDLYHLLFVISFTAALSLWIPAAHRLSALILSISLGLLISANVIFSYNFQFFAVFTLLAMAILDEPDFKKFTRIHIVVIYICCLIYRLSNTYFSGQSVELEILPLINFEAVKQIVPSLSLSPMIAIGAFIIEVVILIGILTKNIYAGLILPLAFHFLISVITFTSTANIFMIAAVMVIAPDNQLELLIHFIRSSKKFLFFTICGAAISYFASNPGQLVAFFFTLILIFGWLLLKQGRTLPSTPYSRWSFQFIVSVLILYSSIPLWDSNLVSQSYSYAMYSGRLYSGTRELYGLGQGLDYKSPRLDSVITKLEPKNFGEQRILRIAKLHWLPEYIKYICKPYLQKHTESSFSILTLYTGPHLPDFNQAVPISRVEYPCLKSTEQWKHIMEEIRHASR